MKLKSFFVLSALFLVGCEEKLPDCTDSKVKEDVLSQMRQAKNEFVYKDIDLLDTLDFSIGEVKTTSINKEINEAYCVANVRAIASENKLNQLIPSIEDKLDQEIMTKYHSEEASVQAEINDPFFMYADKRALKEAEDFIQGAKSRLEASKNKDFTSKLNKDIDEILSSEILTKYNSGEFTLNISPDKIKYMYNTYWLDVEPDFLNIRYSSHILNNFFPGKIYSVSKLDSATRKELKDDLIDFYNRVITDNEKEAKKLRDKIKNKEDSWKLSVENNLKLWNKNKENYIYELRSRAEGGWDVTTPYIIEKVDGKFRVRVL